MARESFIIHFDAIGILEKLDNEQAGKLFNAIANYNLTGDLPDDLQTELLLFPFKNQFDRDKKKYENIANRNKSNGSKGGRPKKTESNPEEPKKPTGLSGNPKEPKKPVSVSAPAPVNVSANVSAKEDQEINKKPKKRFLPPSQEDVFAYATEKELNLNGFFDYFESNGWVVGRGNKMKDWKASARGWSGRQFGSSDSKPAYKAKSFEKTDYSEIPEGFE